MLVDCPNSNPDLNMPWPIFDCVKHFSSYLESRETDMNENMKFHYEEVPCEFVSIVDLDGCHRYSSEVQNYTRANQSAVAVS